MWTQINSKALPADVAESEKWQSGTLCSLFIYVYIPQLSFIQIQTYKQTNEQTSKIFLDRGFYSTKRKLISRLE